MPKFLQENIISMFLRLLMIFSVIKLSIGCMPKFLLYFLLKAKLYFFLRFSKKIILFMPTHRCHTTVGSLAAM